MVNFEKLIAAFRLRYNRRDHRLFRAPGRVNLIGEHTDYNGGFVLPIAIDQETVVAIAPRSDRLLKIWSLDLGESGELNLDSLGPGLRGSWLDHIEGMAAAISSFGIHLVGADIALKSDIPIGSGLASSAALEISVGKALISIAGTQLEDLAFAHAAQAAEHSHVGIKCGIMDPFVAVYAKRNHAILLDCRSLESVWIPLNPDPYQLVICDSRVRHSLALSEYNQRRLDCERSVEKLKEVFVEVQSLRDLSLVQLEAHSSILADRFMRRSRHVISENERTLKAAAALSAGDLAETGRLMFESHASLKNDYQVSCYELDCLVESARAQPGVLGSRMTGGGFGGCTVNLVERTQIRSFKRKISREYEAKTGIRPNIFAVNASEGAGEIFY